MKKISDELVFTKNLKDRNRIIMPPMDTLMSKDGTPNDFHIQHYGSRAYGGVGTVIIESTGISEAGKIRDSDLALYKEEQVPAYKKLVDIVHLASAIVGLQINHAGAKSVVTNAKIIASTNFYSYLDAERKYTLMTEKDLEAVKKGFVRTAKLAKKAGFDFVEIHAAHGYLINSLLHPQLNSVFPWKTIEERMAFLVEIIDKINTTVKIPVGIRMSITDHDPKGVNEDYYKPLIKALSPKVIYFNISSGETTVRPKMDEIIKAAGTKIFRIPPAKKVKSWTDKVVFTGGNVSTKADVLEVMKADLDGAFVGKELIFNPNFVLNTLLDVSEITDDKYHWNNNIWYNPRKYLEIMKALKLK